MSTYIYYIDSDRWDSRNDPTPLQASVRESSDGVAAMLYSISDTHLIDGGWMENEWDVNGLFKYLVDTGYLNADDELIDEAEAIFRSNVKRGYENLKSQSKVQRMQTTRITSLATYSCLASYLNEHMPIENLINYIIIFVIDQPDKLHDPAFRAKIRSDYALKEAVSTVNGKPFAYCEHLGLDARYEESNH